MNKAACIMLAPLLFLDCSCHKNVTEPSIKHFSVECILTSHEIQSRDMLLEEFAVETLIISNNWYTKCSDIELYKNGELRPFKKIPSLDWNEKVKWFRDHYRPKLTLADKLTLRFTCGNEAKKEEFCLLGHKIGSFAPEESWVTYVDMVNASDDSLVDLSLYRNSETKPIYKNQIITPHKVKRFRFSRKIKWSKDTINFKYHTPSFSYEREYKAALADHTSKLYKMYTASK